MSTDEAICRLSIKSKINRKFDKWIRSFVKYLCFQTCLLGRPHCFTESITLIPFCCRNKLNIPHSFANLWYLLDGCYYLSHYTHSPPLLFQYHRHLVRFTPVQHFTVNNRYHFAYLIKWKLCSLLYYSIHRYNWFHFPFLSSRIFYLRYVVHSSFVFHWIFFPFFALIFCFRSRHQLVSFHTL